MAYEEYSSLLHRRIELHNKVYRIKDIRVVVPVHHTTLLGYVERLPVSYPAEAILVEQETGQEITIPMPLDELGVRFL